MSYNLSRPYSCCISPQKQKKKSINKMKSVYRTIKGIVHPKMKILSSCTQVCPKLWVSFFCWTQKKKTCSFSFLNTITDGLERCGLLVDYCDVFISCLDSHSDGTHSLQRIHCWASDVKLHFSKSVPMKNQTHLHIGWMNEWMNDAFI